jgi:hypothetical protein
VTPAILVKNDDFADETASAVRASESEILTSYADPQYGQAISDCFTSHPSV